MAAKSKGKRNTPRDIPQRGLEPETLKAQIRTQLGSAYLGDSVDYLKNHVKDDEVDLIRHQPTFWSCS